MWSDMKTSRSKKAKIHDLNLEEIEESSQVMEDCMNMLSNDFVPNIKLADKPPFQKSEDAYNQAVSLFEKSQNNKKDSQYVWMKKILKSGAVKDKISAHIVFTKEFPPFSLRSIDSLIEYAQKHSRRESVLAIEGLVELFVKYLFPKKKLVHFHKAHSLKGSSSVFDLVCLWFEDRVLFALSQLYGVIGRLMEDKLGDIRRKGVQFAFRLAINRPSRNIKPMELLVNKLGDSTKAVASSALFYVESLVRGLPHVSLDVAKLLEAVLLRPNVSSQTQFYAICCLSQFVFNPDDPGLAGTLIGIYLAFFKTQVASDQQTRTFSVLLEGMYRALPFAQGHYSLFDDHIDTLYRLSHQLPFSTCVRILQILRVVSTAADQSISDRFYSALYARLVDVRLFDCSKPAIFLTLLYKTLSEDSDLSRILSFIKRLLQVCLQHHNPSFVAASLILTSELTSLHPSLLLPKSPFVDQFDPTERNPRFCGVDSSFGLLLVCQGELSLLSRHVHPTISHFCRTLLKGETISYDGRPLQDFTTIRFLDRFVFKKPRRSGSAGHVITSQRKSSRYGMRTLPVNSREFINSSQSAIPLDERYLHHFFHSSGLSSGTFVSAPNEEDGSDVSEFDLLVGESVKEEVEWSDESSGDFGKTAEEFDELLDGGEFGKSRVGSKGGKKRRNRR